MIFKWGAVVKSFERKFESSIAINLFNVFPPHGVKRQAGWLKNIFSEKIKFKEVWI